MEGDLCSSCWTGNLQLHQGMLVCEVCGSIHQGFAEETQEYQTGISDARFFRKSEGMKAKAKQTAAEVETPPPVPVEAAVRAYVSALQRLLQHQAQVLIGTFGVEPGLLGVLRQLWLAHVAHSRLLEPATFLKLEALAVPGGGAPEGSKDEEVGGGGVSSGGDGMPEHLTHRRRSTRIQVQLAPALHPRHTLALLLVACWCQGEAVGPLDVLRWALDGQLPYLAFAAREGAPLSQYRSIIGGELISVRGVPSPKALLQYASSIAHTLNLACPPLSPALWLDKLIAELQLPQELLPVALQLHALYQPAPLVPTEGDRPGRHPWSLLMAPLVVAVKLAYGVGGGTCRLQGLPPPPDWAEWAPRQLTRLSRISAFPLSINEATQLDDSMFRAYLLYLQHGLLADCAPPPDLETVHRLFQKLALAGGGERGASAGSSTGGALLEEPNRQAQQQHTALQEQSAGQGEAGSHAYPFFGTAVWQKNKGLLPADYVLLLTSCAALVWLSPEAMHELVSGVERAMIGAECEVSFMYDEGEQARLWRLLEEGAWAKEREAEHRLKKQRTRKLSEAGNAG